MSQTPRDRLFSALRREPVDRPPVICPGGMMTMATASAMRRVGRAWPAAHSDARAMAEIVLATRDETGLECLAVPFCMTVEAEALGCTVDMGSATVLPHVAVECLTDPARAGLPAGAGGLPEFDPGRSGRAPVVLEAIERLKSVCAGFPVLGGVLGPVTLAAMVMDAGLFLRLTRRDPAAAEKLIAALEPVVVRFALAQHAAGADCVTVAEPSATGEVLGGKHFEKLAAPALIRVLRALRDGGASPILHICGDLRPILPQVALIARSLDAPPAQAGKLALSVDAMVSGRDLKAALPEVVRVGNVDALLLQREDAATVERVARAAARDFDILSPACGLVPTTPAENLQAMVRAAQGRL
ncbi:MAG: uroporphyrinogen decarboxylase family protein [Candidatus Brocadiia bacterium]